MWKISQQFGVTVEAIMEANPQISDPSAIVVGQIIQIPTGESGSSNNLESLTYLYAGTTASYLKILDNSRESIKTVCIDYFDIDSSGNLLITPSNKIDVNFINEMRKRGIKITPFISNHWDRLKGNAALNNREALSTQIVNVINQYGLDGINIDIENVNEQYRAAYTDFTRLLRQKLSSDKLVTVAVAANPKAWNLGWHGSYDYNALAQHSDYLMIMAYDESYQGGPAGPISSSKFFEDSIKYALNQGVPKQKIVTGIPFFGRYWRQGDPSGGIGITARDIEYLVKHYRSQMSYDEARQSAKAVVTILDSDTKPMIWGGRVLGAGVYEIWYDNAKAVSHKLHMISKYGIRGAGSWALGQEDTAIWSFYTSVLDGTAAPPVPPPTNPSDPNISVQLNRIISTLNRFVGNRYVDEKTKLTRGEYAVILAELCGLAPEPNSPGFADTGNYWGKGQLHALRRRGIINGAGNNYYYPDRLITRQEICTLMERILVLPNTIDFHTFYFKDVPTSLWSYNAITKMNYFGLVYGHNQMFMPTNDITTSTFAIILSRIDQHKYVMNADKYLFHLERRGLYQLDPVFKEPIIDPR